MIQNCKLTVKVVSILTIGSLGLLGCSGQKMADVTGRIIYEQDETPATDLEGFRVSFLHSSEEIDGKSNRTTATGLVRKDGTFTMSTFEMEDGVVLGTHQIAITPPVIYGDAARPKEPIIDPRYSRPEQSGLTAVVEGDTEVVLKVQRIR